MLTLLAAFAVVAAARWAAARLDVLWQAQQLRVTWRASRPAFAAAHARPPRGARRGPDAAVAAAAQWAPAAGAGGDAWRRAFPDADVAAEVEALASRVVDEARPLLVPLRRFFSFLFLALRLTALVMRSS